MLKEYSKLFQRLMIAFDLVIAGGSFFLAYLLRGFYGGLFEIRYYFNLLPLLIIVLIYVYYVLGLYWSFRTRSVRELIVIIFKGSALAFLIFGSFLFLFKIESISRLLTFYTFLLSAIFISIEKIILVNLFRYFRDKGYNFRNILVVGMDERARNFIRSVNHHREWGLSIIGVVDKNNDVSDKELEGHPVIGGLNDVAHIIHMHAVDEVLFFVPSAWLDKIEGIIRVCEVEGVKVNVSVDFMYRKYCGIKLNKIHDFSLITFDRSTDKLGLLFVKQVIDVVIGALALVALLPVHAVIIILIKITSPGPVFFCQERYGLNGRRFKLIKFRTMTVDADRQKEALLDKNEMSGPVFKISNDPRITPLGRFLRKTSLDELPQLWNILKGEMSLVGPRPPIPLEVEQYDNWHRRRTRMRPGLTCLWQVSGRNNITDFNNWVKLDLEYIDKWSLWLDFKILFKTIPVVLFGIGAK